MIHDIQDQGQTTAERRVLAVVAGEKSRAQEVAVCFAQHGDRVNAVWYPDTRRLLEACRGQHYEAIILFAAMQEEQGNAEEAEVRSAMLDTPLYRL